ncbi:MAG: hypothetical protein KA745_03000 [Gemmatimonadales bacterium]|nr:hypothetical protein [Gemmatimonadales bacterium]
MSVVQVNQIKNQLHKLFDGLIDLSDLQNKSADEVEQHFLTRSLGAYAVATISGTQPAVAAAHVTDGFKDNGLDVVYFDDAEKRLYLVQSKWVTGANKAPELGDVLKFVAGARDLVSGDLSTFNAKTQALSANIQRALADTDLRIVLVVIYTSIQPLSGPAMKALSGFQDEMNEVSDLVEVSTFSLKKVYQALTTVGSGNSGH